MAAGMIGVNGAELRYEVAGVGETVVVLHGGPGIGYDYLAPELRQLFSDRYRLVFYDQRGGGRSSGAEDPARLNIGTFVEDWECVLDSMGIECAILMGHSFGELLAIQCAVRNPPRVKALLLVEGDPACRSSWRRFAEVIGSRSDPTRDDAAAAIHVIEGWDAKPEWVARYYELRLRP